MATTEIWTYQDIVEHILDVYDDSRAGRPLRMAKRAASEALRALQTAHSWAMYNGTRHIHTVAPYATGTIYYDHTGGASERLVTLSGGTFPSWAAFGKILIAGVAYPVESYVDSTHVVLDPNVNPGADVASSTAYTLYRDEYPLPVGFKTLGQLWNVTEDEELDVVFADQATRDSVSDPAEPGDPEYAYVTGDSDYINNMSLVFLPPPDSELVFRYDFQRSPRQLVTEKYSTGTVTVAGGSTTCTITTGAFTQSHVGCVIRFGTTDNEPDNRFGGLGDTTNTFTDERTIVSVASNGLTCTLDAAPSAAITSVKFTVSDPIDVEVGAMLTAYQRLCESTFAILTKRDQKDSMVRIQLAERALLEAKDADRRIDQVPAYYEATDRIGDVNVLGE